MSEMDKINGANWMSSLCSDLPITAINMPGTHDSATKYVRFKPICNTQNLTIEEQLQIGVRYLDMRFELKDGRKLVAVHSIADCKRARLKSRRPHCRRYCKYVRKFSQREPRRDNSVSA